MSDPGAITGRAAARSLPTPPTDRTETTPADATPAPSSPDREIDRVADLQARARPRRTSVHSRPSTALQAIRDTPHARSPGDLEIRVRSFHFAREFSGFHGDGRGFSTRPEDTSRVNSSVVVHEGDAGFDKDIAAGGFSNASRSVVPMPISEGVGLPHVDAALTEYARDHVRVQVHAAGANPLVLASPDADVHGDISMTRLDAHRVQVDFRFEGDAFPNAEAFVRDHAGNAVFLGVHALMTEHSIADLPGDPRVPMMTGSVVIRKDAEGVIEGVELNGELISCDEWNAVFTAQSPGNADYRPDRVP